MPTIDIPMFVAHLSRLSRISSVYRSAEAVMAAVAEAPAAYEVCQEQHSAGPDEPLTPLMRACQQDDLDRVRGILDKQVSGVQERGGTVAQELLTLLISRSF